MLVHKWFKFLKCIFLLMAHISQIILWDFLLVVHFIEKLADIVDIHLVPIHRTCQLMMIGLWISHFWFWVFFIYNFCIQELYFEMLCVVFISIRISWLFPYIVDRSFIQQRLIQFIVALKLCWVNKAFFTHPSYCYFWNI